jgi:hypothetical protein
MQYQNCVEGVQYFKHTAETSNIHKDADQVKCPTAPTACIIVGNSDPLYACLNSGAASSQRVYDFGQRWKDTRTVPQE